LYLCPSVCPSVHPSGNPCRRSHSVGVKRRTTVLSAIAVTPPTGLLVYQTDGTTGFYYFNGTVWAQVSSASYTETDPVFAASIAKGITGTDTTHWNTAYRWGNHATQGYLKNTSPTVAGDMMTFDGSNWVSKKLVVGISGNNVPISIMQPYLVLNYCIALYGIFPSRNGVEPFIGEIELLGFNFAPQNFATCDGQLMSIQQNTALFSLLGTYYGGNGQTNFALPDLRGRVAIHQGNGQGLTPRTIGEFAGTESISISISNMPQHTHPVVYQ